MTYMMHCKWQSEKARVVLEVQSENSKATTDSEPCSIGNLLREMEEEGMTDVKLHGHSCSRPPPQDQGGDSCISVSTNMLLKKIGGDLNRTEP